MKKLLLVATVILAFFCLMTTDCKNEDELQTDPVATIGHGAFISQTGAEMKVDAGLIESVQKLYLKNLKASIENRQTKNYLSPEEIESARQTISAEVEDGILADALLFDFLIQKSQPKEGAARLSIVSNALREEYVFRIMKNPILPQDSIWSKGIPIDKARRLGEKLGMVVLAITTASSGEAYCRECLEAGVPVPRDMFGGEWRYVGNIENPFISRGNRAELWIHESESPKGVCLALPRFPPGSNRASLFGVICLGTNTNKACFFDNKPSQYYERGLQIDFKSSFIGGTQLQDNISIGGMCSDCHAGENPYVVHPDQAVFSGIINKLQTTAWYDPIVDASWLQNPGPSNLLDAVVSTTPGRCNSCHIQGLAGRFPELSSQLNGPGGYCINVFENAIGPLPVRTMPRGGGEPASFMDHINAMRAACSNPPRVIMVRQLNIEIEIGPDGVRGQDFAGTSHLLGDLHTLGGSVLEVIEFNNIGSRESPNWRGWGQGTHNKTFTFSRPITISDINRLDMYMPAAGGGAGDNVDINRVIVRAVLIDGTECVMGRNNNYFRLTGNNERVEIQLNSCQ